jgi:hypothetical protein
MKIKKFFQENEFQFLENRTASYEVYASKYISNKDNDCMAPLLTLVHRPHHPPA